jgi:hypothetical protein
MLNLLLHEMIHVAQKNAWKQFMIKRERMAGLLWNAFHEQYPKFLNSLNFTNAFAK